MHFISILFSACINFGFFKNILGEIPIDSNVYVLNSENFDEFINANNIIMVEFYAPWCGHCKQLTPIYTKAAVQLKKNNPPILLGKVDATVESELATRFGISGYPTLKFFKSGIPYDYDDSRSESAIVNFMKKVGSPDWQPPKNYVLTLTKENFTEIVESSGYILVEFFAPWCGHCKSLAPEFAKAAKILSNLNPPIQLATVDATVETDLAKEYHVSGYPTLKLFKNKNFFVDYSGPRSSDGIVDWMIKNRENAAKAVSSILDFRNVQNPQRVLLLGLFSSENDLLFTTFIDATNLFREDFSSIYSFSDEIRLLYDANVDDGIGSIILLRPEYLRNIYEPDFTKFQHLNSNVTPFEVMSFIEKNMFPIVAEYDFRTKVYLEKLEKKFLCIFFFTVDFSIHHKTATKKWLEKITKIAVNYKDQIQFAIADDERQSDKLRELRLDDSGEEINVGCIGENDMKYRMSAMDEFDSEHIRKFLDSILAGKVFPILKSAPIPKTPLSEGITTVVGDTYKELINDIPGESLLLLYRSPCKSCQSLRNILSSLSSTFSGKSLKFFSMDLSQNDMPPISGLEYERFQPTVNFIMDSTDSDPNSLLRKKAIKFRGDQLNEYEIKSFILKNSKVLKDEL